MKTADFRLLTLLSSFVLVCQSAEATCSSHPADVAPGVLGSEMPTPSWTVTGDDAVDVQDVLVLLNGAVGKYTIVWSPPVGASCPALAGNLAPGSQDDGFSPPRWTPTPDAAIDVGDVLVALRLAVVLIDLDPAWLTPILSDGQVGDRLVAGSVIDSVSALGLPAVVVTAIVDDAPVGATSTDAAGKFLLQGLPSGAITLSLDGSGSTAAGKFSTLEVQIEVDSTATTSVQPLTLADETDPAGATGKFTGDETGTVDEAIALSSGDGDVGLATGPGGKIEIDGAPADMEVDLSVVPLEGEDLPEPVTNDTSGEGLNSTGEAAVGPAEGKFTGGGAGLSAVGAEPGFDLTLPNRRDLPLGTMVDIWHWDGAAWANCTEATGRSGTVIDVGGGMTAVFAAGVATDGGLYSAAVPIDFFCTSAVSGQVLDDAGAPLAGVTVRTSLGPSGITDAFGFFYIPDLPAYSGVDLGDCLPIGYRVFVRGGVELGGAAASVVVDEFDVFLGSEVYVGEIQLTVPNEGCLSGLVLSNGVGLSGPVTITGPENLVVAADGQGRFSRLGLMPGSYRASFQFPGEPLPREFSFEIVARRCATVRLAVNAGSGSRRLTVSVLYDDDGDLLTPNGPAAGALVRLIGSDPVSALGLQAVAGGNGQVSFDGVDPPYDVVAIIERPLMDGGLSLSSPGDYPIMRIGAGLVTPAPIGVASLLLQPPVSATGSYDFPPGSMEGLFSNLPDRSPGQFFSAAALERGAFDEVFGGFVDDNSGQYYADAFETPFDLAIGLMNEAWPNPPSEIAFFGPFQLPPSTGIDDPRVLMESFNYLEGDRLLFDRPLSLTHTNFFTSANNKTTTVTGKRTDGRSFTAPIAAAGSPDPFPSSVLVPDPASTNLSLALEFSSPANVESRGQFCLVPLRAPLPAMLTIDHLIPPDINGPPGGFGGTPLPLDELVNGPVDYDTAWNVSDNGYDSIIYETFFESAGPGELGRTVFRRYLPAMVVGSGSIGPTPLPFAFPGVDVFIGVESVRGDGFPASHVDLFGPALETILQGLFFQADPVCQSARTRGYSVEPP